MIVGPIVASGAHRPHRDHRLDRVASLGFWGGLAGRRAGFTGRQLVLAVLAGLLVGFLVLAIQVFLQPGKAATNGVV